MRFVIPARIKREATLDPRFSASKEGETRPDGLRHDFWRARG